MKRNNAYSVILTVAIAGSFCAGIFEPELRAQGGLPERFTMLSRGGSGRSLDPVQTYSKVLQVVKDRYVGELPSDRKLTFAAIRGLMASLDDPYTRFLEPEEYRALREENQGEFEGIGAQLDPQSTPEGYVKVLKPLPNGPAAKAGLKRGDMITKVDGKSVVGMTVDQAVQIIRGKAGSIVRLTVSRVGEAKAIEIAIQRAPVEFEVVEHKMLEGNIGYISLQQFNEMADPKIERAIQEMRAKGMKGLILDLRGNPGGLLDAAIDISSRFVEPRKNAVIIVESGGERSARETDPRKFIGKNVPVVVLINRTSASASEIVAGAVKDNSAGTLVGTTTFGKGLVQTVVPLEDNSACMITTAKYLTPSGKDINRGRDQRGGVEPDVKVEVTEEQWLKREDPQLRKAVEILYEKIGATPPAAPNTARPGMAQAQPNR